jgi:glutaconate CoA-transferase subunit B
MSDRPAASLQETLAAWIADQLADGECVWAGTNLPVPRARMLLAHWTDAPNLRVLLSFYQHNFSGGRSPPSSDMFADGRLRHGSEMNVMNHRGEAFSHILDIDVFFVGGLQVDRYGNTNLIGICDGDGGFKLRGAGPAGATSFSADAQRYYVYTTRHTKRSFVEEVDFVSTVGPARRRELDLPGGGPEKVISPLGIFGFADDELELEATMPGLSTADVQEATGFNLQVADDVVDVPAPTDEQLDVLRNRVDPDGYLRETND